MGALAWVELLDSTRHVRSRIRVESAPALIGRGYGADILLDDPWISPLHLRLFRELDGSLSVEDAGSENGVWSERGERVTSLPVGRGVILRVGRTLLRVVPADAPVAPTLPLHAAAPGAGGIDRRGLGPLLGLAAGALFAWGQFLGEADAPRVTSLIGDALAAIVAITIWAGVWSLVTRASSHRARFGAHLTVSSLGAVVIMGLVNVMGYADFLAPGAPGLSGTIAMVAFAVAAAVLYGHLMIATALPAPRAVAISVAITFGLAALAGLAAQDAHDDEGTGQPKFSSELKPLRAGVIPVEDTTVFFNGTAELKTSVDSIATDDQ